MQSDDIAISVRGLGKDYRLFGHPGDRIKQFFSLGFKRYHKAFSALVDVDFDVRRGETVGIIGRNGSGKSTLLQLMCGILKPTRGEIRVKGRVSALLELGAGFNPEFTGRENIYFQGALMGFTKAQMDERFDAIAGFADIGEFIDEPVRTYSSGMFVRLAFASAIHVDPEIFIVDEALAVGDRAFQAKCFERIASIREKGGAVVIVTHALEQVAHFCDRALMLDKGRLMADGSPTETIEAYLSRLRSSDEQPPAAGESSSTWTLARSEDGFLSHPAYNPAETRWGDGAASICRVRISQEGHDDPQTVVPGRTVQLEYWVRFHADIEHPIYGLSIKSPSGALIFSVNSRQLAGLSRTTSQRAGDLVGVVFTFTPYFECGDYLISVGVAGEALSGIQPHDRRYDSLRMRIAYPLDADAEIDLSPALQIVQSPT